MQLIKPETRTIPWQATAETGVAASVARLAVTLAGIDAPIEVFRAARDAVAEARAAERTIKAQAERLAALEHLSTTDALTGLLNRRGFEAALARATSGAERYRETGVLIFIDLDGFKPVNDSFGHAAGDAVLKAVAGVLAANVRDTDAVGRLGGDEFAVLLARTDWEPGLARAETFDKLINGAGVTWQGARIAVRASLGIQTYGPGDDVRALLASADHAMYTAKRVRAEGAR